jgi:hypothetical protein
MDTVRQCGDPGQKSVHVAFINADTYREAFRAMKICPDYKPYWQMNPNPV